MHKVAASVLREAGRADEAGDAVQDAIVSVLASPPGKVANWEAFLVTAAKRRAWTGCVQRRSDMLGKSSNSTETIAATTK